MFDIIGREVLARTVSFSPPEGAGPGTTSELDDGDSVREATAWVVKA
jgi:hypothetical protein